MPIPYLPLINPGKLEVYAGPMNSGKTLEIIYRVEHLHYNKQYDINKTVVFFKPNADKRSDYIESRSGHRKYPAIKLPDDEQGETFKYITPEHKIIVYDEAQFFCKSLIKTIDGLLLQDKNVIVTGLDLDFRGEPFGIMPELFARADYILKLIAACEYPGCGNPANRTQRLINGRPAQYGDTLVRIGDRAIEGDVKQSYEARCLKHHEVPGKPE